MRKHPHRIDEFRHILGQRRFPRHRFATQRMDEPKPACVQRLTPESRAGRYAAGARAVDGIADQRMADRLQMHAYLVRTTGFKRAFNQRTVEKAFDDAIMRARRLAALRHGHACPLPRMPSDRRIDRAAVFDEAARQRIVMTLDRARLQLAHQIGLRFGRASHDHQPAGVLVEAMDDTGARHPIELRGMVEQGIEQGAMPVAATGMYDQPGRLVDDHQAFILENHIERDIFRRRGKPGFIGRFDDFDRLAPP